jgi:FtsH-binding integral membrane protein
MPHDITASEAEQALTSIDYRRGQVLAEVDLPRWYWWGLALGWVALGFVVDLGIAWATAAATLTFGAVHASVVQRVASGRHRTGRLSVRADVVSPHLPAAVIAFVVGLGGVTILLGVLFSADGAGHPVTIASLVVAVALVCGGPSLVAAVQRRSRPA